MGLDNAEGMRLRRALFIATGMVTLAACWLGYAMFREDRLETRFEQLPMGATQADTVKLLGKPWRAEGCGKSLGSPTSGCFSEYLYPSPLLLPETYSVRFDSSGRVYDKYFYSSP
jgi:hypothetical protein